MAEDTWRSTAMPILQFLATRGTGDLVSVCEITEATGIDGNSVVDELDRLISAHYIVSNFRKMMTGGDPSSWFLEGARLGERGARAVGMWPSEDAGPELQKAVERLEDLATTPAEKSKVARVRDAMTDAGTDIVAKIAAEYLKAVSGIR